MRFGVLGPLVVWTRDGAVVPVPEAKVRSLLADLLVHEGRPVAVERLVEHLWGAHPPGNPLNTLQTKVSQLRRALEPAGARDVVVREPAGYRLLIDADDVDVQRFRALTRRGQGSADPHERVALLSDALALWRGPALADVAEQPFAIAAARGWEEERLVALEECAEARLALGEVGPAVAELADLVARYPQRERLRGLHMLALYRAGRQGEALASYAELRSRLVDELGLEPGPELAALQQAILAHDPALHLPSTAPVRRPIAAALTELVGREAAVRDVQARLRTARLVTLTGAGGVGKTRLAMEAARRQADGLPGGVCVVELAGLDRHVCPEVHDSAAEWVVEVVAAALGVRDAADGHTPGAERLAERIGEALHDQELLLVLDNCEQVIDAVAALALRLLQAAPGLRILATSREPLGVPGEVLWHVPPLELPVHPEETEPAVVGAASSVQLFVARAAAAAPGFTLDERNAAAVAAICRRLDGLPLALELAASRVRALGVHELLARLDDRFRLLAGGPRGAPARQRTLRAVIDWSWELLTAEERVVLRRLAVHPEGCDLDAAEAVCGGEGVPPGEVLDLLIRLVDRSLVVSQAGHDGRPRFRLLETVAAYCLERMAEAGELEQVRHRHARHHLALAERAEPELRGPDQRRWLERLDAESANLRIAFEHLTQRADGAALRLVDALAWYWFLRGRLGEAARSLRQALAVPGSAPPALRARVAAWLEAVQVLDGRAADAALLDPRPDPDDPVGRARAQWFLGYALTTLAHPRCEQLTCAALAAFEALGDRWGTAAALVDRASQLAGRGELARAREHAERSAARFREVGDRWGQVQATFALGMLDEIAGAHEQAAEQHRAGLRMAEELGLWSEVSYQLSWLGRIALLSKRFGEAEELHERAVAVAVTHGFAPGRIYGLTGLALGARRTGRLDIAENHLRTVLEWHLGTGTEHATSLIHAELGFVAELRGDTAAALRHHLDSYGIAREAGDPRALALALEGLAGAAVLARAPEQAARLLGAAAATREGIGAPLPAAERGDVERITAAAAGAFGQAEFAAEFTRGAATPAHELVEALPGSDVLVHVVGRDPELVPRRD